MTSPAASMIPSITSRNASASSRNTKRLAMKAPNISDDPAIRPLSATSGVSAPNRSKVQVEAERTRCFGGEKRALGKAVEQK